MVPSACTLQLHGRAAPLGALQWESGASQGPDPLLLPQALPLFLDRLTDPVTAVIVSVTAVLLFGELHYVALRRHLTPACTACIQRRAVPGQRRAVWLGQGLASLCLVPRRPPLPGSSRPSVYELVVLVAHGEGPAARHHL